LEFCPVWPDYPVVCPPFGFWGQGARPLWRLRRQLPVKGEELIFLPRLG